jgi:hypothetical protein
MSLKFINDNGCGHLEYRDSMMFFTVSVDRLFEDEKNIEQTKQQLNNILNGQRNITALLACAEGESSLSINNDDIFNLTGGAWSGQAFASDVRFYCSYSKNKEEIDKLLRFLLKDD